MAVVLGGHGGGQGTKYICIDKGPLLLLWLQTFNWWLCHHIPRIPFPNIGKIKDEEAVKLITDIAKSRLFSKQSTNPKLRASACWALGKIGGKDAHKVLNKLKSDSENIVRKTAIHALKHYIESK